MAKSVASAGSASAYLNPRNWLSLATSNRELVLPLGFLFLIATLIVGVPNTILSIMVIANLAISIIILLTSLNIKSAVELTSFPTILLLTTIFRLTISVSATRNILSEGDAGAVIHALGSVTARGDMVIGFVMFIMVLVVQFIVVAKGSERVSEVAARFTLDAMPGKQMAIDADLRSGLISQDQARDQRNELQKESQLHGAMDGAMKFVKGDTVATIIIALVNIIAGLVMGTVRKKLDIAEAARVYTQLTIGDGLAAIISSMLITIAAGIVVTRVAANDEETSVGSDITSQIFAKPNSFYITGGVFLLMGVVAYGFIIFGGALLAGGYFLNKKQQAKVAEQLELDQKDTLVGGSDDELQPSFTVPLAIVVSTELTSLVDKNTARGERFREELPKLRSSLYYDLGVMLPYCHVSGDAPLKPNQYFIALKEVPVGFGYLKPDCVYVNDSAENIRVFGLDGDTVVNPADLRPGCWVPVEQRHIAEAAGLKVWEPEEVITLHLSRILRKYAHEFVGIQETQGYLDFAGRGLPKLVEEVVGKTVSIQQVTDVLQRLVQEGISIRDIKSVLDALGEWGRVEKDTVMLTEYVRSSMRRYISFRYTGGKDTLFVYLLDPEIEDVIRGAIRRTSTGAFLSLDPAITHDILDAIRREVANLPPTAQQPVIVTDMELRRFVRKMVELEFPTLSVVSFQELAPELNVQPIGRISMHNNMFEPSDDFAAMESEFNEMTMLEG